MTVRLVVRDVPRPVAPTPSGPRVALAAEVETISTDDQERPGGGDVLVLAPSRGWDHLQPSQRATALVRAVPVRQPSLDVAVLFARGPPTFVTPPSTVHAAAASLRAGLRTSAEVLPPEAAGLLPGLVLGDTSRLDPAVREDFRTAGLAHLLAVSGANCAIVVGAVLLALRALGAGPRLAALGGGVALAGFVILVQPSPSVLRAAVMGAVGLLALATGRPRSALPALSVAVLGLVLAAPDLARSIGFGLSVAATVGLIVLAPRWSVALRGRGVPRGLAEALAVSTAAYLTTAPLTAALDGRVGIVAIPANLLASPAVAPVTVLGTLAAAVQPLSGLVATALAAAAGPPLAWLIWTARLCAALPLPTLTWPDGSLGVALGVLAVLTVLVLGRMGLGRVVSRSIARSRRLWAGSAVVVLAVTVIVHLGRPSWPPDDWLLVMCDVGQGDALAVRVEEGSALVVDAGPGPEMVDQCLRRLDIDRVPLVVLTHMHADHVRGLPGVFQGRRVGAVEVGPLEEPVAAARAVRRIAAARGVPVLNGSAGEVRAVGGVRMTIVGPRAAYHSTRSDPNNSSLVLRVETSGRTLLLTGDIETVAQEALVRRHAQLAADVLKVPHHGSAHTDPRFLAATSASVAVVSVGEGNDYGHPAPELLDMLDRLGIRAYRTDLSGDVAVYEDSGRLVVATHPSEPP